MGALTELVVQTPCLGGTLYLASGWIHVGSTLKRGRHELRRKYNLPNNDNWLRSVLED